MDESGHDDPRHLRALTLGLLAAAALYLPPFDLAPRADRGLYDALMRISPPAAPDDILLIELRDTAWLTTLARTAERENARLLVATQPRPSSPLANRLALGPVDVPLGNARLRRTEWQRGGHLWFRADTDGIVRHDDSVLEDRQPLPSLAYAAARHLAHEGHGSLDTKGGAFDRAPAPLGEAPGRHRLRFFDPASFPVLTPSEVLAAPERLEGKIVVAGAPNRIHRTPFGPAADHELLAQALAGYRLEREVVAGPAGPWTAWTGGAMLLAITLFAAPQGLGPRLAAGAAGATALVAFSGGAFVLEALWVPVAGPAMLLVAAGFVHLPRPRPRPGRRGYPSEHAGRSAAPGPGGAATEGRTAGATAAKATAARAGATAAKAAAAGATAAKKATAGAAPAATSCGDSLDRAWQWYRTRPASKAVLGELYELGCALEGHGRGEMAADVFHTIAQTDHGYRDAARRLVVSARIGSQAQPFMAHPPPRPFRTLPAKLGRYELLEEIGHGATGFVFLAHDPRIGRIVAVKVVDLSCEFQTDDLDDARQSFLREAETAGRLNHPDIVTIFDVGDSDGLAYIAMEYLKGRRLADFANDAQRLPPALLLDLFARAADALNYAHKQNVVHRDIKPANIMYDSVLDSLKITDFGIARLIDASRTRTGIVLGTPSFMAPEQLEGENVNGHTDLFALGVSLYQLLTGRLPFRGNSMTKLMFVIANEPHQPVTAIDPELPRELDPLFAKALAKNPHERFSTGADMAEALRAIAAKAG